MTNFEVLVIFSVKYSKNVGDVNKFSMRVFFQVHFMSELIFKIADAQKDVERFVSTMGHNIKVTWKFGDLTR